jgi:hypothetical protein
MKVSFYQGGIKQTTSFDAIAVIETIRSKAYELEVSRLRNATDDSVRKVLKNALPYVTWSGVFTKRQNDCLTDHSGLLCIDFDHLPDLDNSSAQIAADKYTFARFTSPGGEGLKILVRIDPDRHLDSFLALEKHYLENYGLVVDKSGKDVARACFLSYDPYAYVNKDAEEFPLEPPVNKGIKPLLKDPEPSAPSQAEPVQAQKLNRKELDRVMFAIEIIEGMKIDITSEYDDWLKIAFALSTLGETGRDLFHRVSVFSPKYEFEVADSKFSECLKNRSRIRSCTPFFRIAEDYGISTKRPREAKEGQSGAELLPEDVDEEEFNKYGFFEHKGMYWALNSNGGKYAVSNFTMEILFHVRTGGEEAYRLIKIKNIHGYEAVINMNTDDFVSLSSFRKLIARRGNYLWKGAEHDLVRLQDKLQREERATILIDVLGYHPTGNFYAFANGIIDMAANSTFKQADEYGIVQHNDRNYFIPANSKIYLDKEDMFYNYKKFIFKHRELKLKEWFTLFDKVYGEKGRVGFIFYVASLYSSSIYKLMGRRFPILNLYGQRGSGKGTFAESLMCLFGEPQEQIMLGGNTTQVGFMRTFAQFKDAMVWLDEYKNNLHKKVIEAIKNIYDRIGYKRGKKDHSFEVDYVPVQSACILSGQEMPTIEPALYTRVIMLTFSESKHNEESRVAFRKLMQEQELGLSHLTVHLLGHGPYIIEHFKEVFETEVKEIAKEINNAQVEERMINNYACLSTVCKLLLDKESLGFKHYAFRGLLIKNLSIQQAVLVGSDDTTKFWQVIESLFNQDLIKEDRDFMLADGKLFIRIQNVSGLYEKEMRQRNDPNVLQKSTLEHYLELDKSKYVGRQKKAFKNGSYTWCMVFNYKALDIGLMRFSPADTAEVIKSRYQEMGVEYESVTNETNSAPPF